MERLTAVEFLAPSDLPQIVRLLGATGEVVAQFAFVGWLGVDLRPFNLAFERQGDLAIEGKGLGKPYWNDALPSWLGPFDSYAEAKRIVATREAVVRELNRARIALVPS